MFEAILAVVVQLALVVVLWFAGWVAAHIVCSVRRAKPNSRRSSVVPEGVLPQEERSHLKLATPRWSRPRNSEIRIPDRSPDLRRRCIVLSGLPESTSLGFVSHTKPADSDFARTSS